MLSDVLAADVGRAAVGVEEQLAAALQRDLRPVARPVREVGHRDLDPGLAVRLHRPVLGGVAALRRDRPGHRADAVLERALPGELAGRVSEHVVAGRRARAALEHGAADDAGGQLLALRVRCPACWSR